MSETIGDHESSASVLKRTFTGPKPPLKPRQIWSIRTRLNLAKRSRDAALFDLAIDSKLRGCDLVRLRIGDIALHGAVRSRTTVVQRKTGRPVQFEITEQARSSVQSWLKIVGARPEAYVFPSRIYRERHLSTRQYARLVDEWVGLIGLDPSAYGTHSLRRTKAALIYKRTGNLRAVQLLLGHSAGLVRLGLKTGRKRTSPSAPGTGKDDPLETFDPECDRKFVMREGGGVGWLDRRVSCGSQEWRWLQSH